jgi:hypothetical protein
MLVRSDPETAAALLVEAQKDVEMRWKLYEHWASLPYSNGKNGGSEA